MILLLGATGYIGQAFAAELRRRGLMFIPLTRAAVDYTDFNILFDYVRKAKPEFLINAAGYTGWPNADACESARGETLQGNTVFPQTVARVCLMTDTPWGHVSSGSIYSGAKVLENGVQHIRENLSDLRLHDLFAKHPERFYGFTEFDEPNFCFRSRVCSFYSGTKALAEEALRGIGPCYIWRLSIPFDEFDHPRNFLTRIQGRAPVHDTINSLSHRGDFVRACLDLWKSGAAMGTYNVANSGAVTTLDVVREIQRGSKESRRFEVWKGNQGIERGVSRPWRSNYILDVSKLQRAGIKMSNVQHALKRSIERWITAPGKVAPSAQPVNAITDVDFSLTYAQQNLDYRNPVRAR